jgi:hypothetical protein
MEDGTSRPAACYFETLQAVDVRAAAKYLYEKVDITRQLREQVLDWTLAAWNHGVVRGQGIDSKGMVYLR